MRNSEKFYSFTYLVRKEHFNAKYLPHCMYVL